MHKRVFLSLLAHIESNAGMALDVGCGGGRWVKIVHEHGYRAFGIDPSLPAISSIRQGKEGFFVSASGAALPFKNTVFSLVSIVTVLQHLPYETQERVVSEIARVIRPGAFGIVMEHSLASGKRSADVSWEGVYPRAIDEWSSLLQNAGFTIVLIRKFQYHPCSSFAQKFLDRFERFYNSKRSKKPSSVPQSQSNIPSCTAPESDKPSARLKIYRWLKMRCIDLCIIPDWVLDRIIGNTRGTHSAMLIRKN